MTPTPRTLFVGKGRTGICWYRIALPAMALGHDWIAVAELDKANPGTRLRIVSGQTAVPLAVDDIPSRYDVVVVQQPRGRRWLARVRAWQAAGVTVLYEIDDYLHGIAKLPYHAFKSSFSAADLSDHELVMGACDGLITSVDFIARRYGKHVPQTFVCRNGLDLARYAVTRPASHGADGSVTVGWSGATGHVAALTPWLRELVKVMVARPHVRFVSIGQSFADVLAKEVGADRCLSIPFGALETYPAAMLHMDIGLAPAGTGHFWRGKSDLRFLEAGALGIPLVADPGVYPTLRDGVSGFHAADPARARARIEALVDDAELRTRLGQAAREYVQAERTIHRTAPDWTRAIAAAHASAGRRRPLAA